MEFGLRVFGFGVLGARLGLGVGVWLYLNPIVTHLFTGSFRKLPHKVRKRWVLRFQVLKGSWDLVTRVFSSGNYTYDPN